MSEALRAARMKMTRVMVASVAPDEKIISGRFQLLPAHVAADLVDDLVTAAGQLLLHSPQGRADHVAMMEPRPKLAGLTEREPDLVQQVDVFRPQARGMRAEIDIDRRPVRTDHFERERVAGLGRLFPRRADAVRQLVGFHARAYA